MSKHLPALIGLCLVLGLASCTDDGESAESTGEEAAIAARVRLYREGIPEFAREVCDKHGTNDSEYGPACREAAVAFLEAVAVKLETSPLSWERQVIALGGICQREAFRYSQSEWQRRSEQDLLVVGLEKGPACLDRQYELLKELAKKQAAEPPS